MSDALPVPEALLAPLVECAGDTLRALDADAVPSALRHLQSFDRRGFMHGPAPRQVVKSLTRDEAFKVEVVSRFRARADVIALRDAWDAARAVELADRAAGDGELPLLASMLWALEPPGYEYGLGAAHARYERSRAEHEELSDAQASARTRETIEEARRRSDAARMAAQAELERVERELREERKARRGREEEAIADAAAARRTADGLIAQLEQSNAAVAAAEARAAREARRAQELEADVRKLRAELESARSAQPALPATDLRALQHAADAAKQLSSTLDDVARRAKSLRATSGTQPASRARSRGKAPARRVSPELPAGVVSDSATGADAMLRTDGVTLIVDGYNVAKRAWPEATPSDQRERLALALAALHARTGCSSTVVFDGDAAGGASVPVLRRRGLRVLFSAAGEEADDVVVREVERLPKRVPVVVASSDAWVREHAEREGSVVIGADTLLAVAK
jgi:predicted RNA-binding protein with PIN domain